MTALLHAAALNEVAGDVADKSVLDEALIASAQRLSHLTTLELFFAAACTNAWIAVLKASAGASKVIAWRIMPIKINLTLSWPA